MKTEGVGECGVALGSAIQNESMPDCRMVKKVVRRVSSSGECPRMFWLALDLGHSQSVTSTKTMQPDSVSQTGPPPLISASNPRTPPELLLLLVATGCPKVGRKRTVPLSCIPRWNVSEVWQLLPHLLHVSAKTSKGSRPGDMPHYGPETPMRAASPSTTISALPR